MKCGKCGADIPEGAKTCPECGAPAVSADAAAKKSGDDFDKEYSKMFSDSAPEENKYQIDEELRKKREARYDDSFANMTDDEKIKALEAARLARKEKRERKQQKKAEGGIFSSMKSGKPGRSESADKRKPRAERGETKRGSDAAKSAGSEGAAKAREGRAAKGRRKKFKPSPKAGLIAGGILAVLVIAVVIASVNMATKVTVEMPETPTVYAKGNTLFSAYDGKELEISGNFVSSEYVETTEPTATPSRRNDDEDEEATPTTEPVFEPLREKDIVTYTADGIGTYFIDNADFNNSKGTLNYTQNGKRKSTVKIADDVYAKVLVSDDGTGVMYLVGADKFGNGGTLWFWSSITQTASELAPGVLPEHFVFGQNTNSLLYINEYNSEYNVGNLHMATVEKGVVTGTKAVDSDVYDVFGTNPSGKAVVYAKNYNTENQCFDLYLEKADSDEKVMITGGSRCEPIFCAASDGMYAGGTYGEAEEYYQSLYYVSLAGGEKERLSNSLTELVSMSSDEQAVVFRKANAEGTAFDYYYANLSGTEGQMLAQNITVLDDEDHKRVVQFDINDDFTKAAFIQGYDIARECGALFSVAITNGVVGSDTKISDTAHSCDITPDGQVVRYADGYDITWNLVNLNAWSGEKITALADEVGAGAFTFDKNGNYTVYAKNYSLETRTGDVYCVSNKGKTREVVKGVSSYGLKNNGDIVYYNSNGGNFSFELFRTRDDGKKAKTIDTDVTEVVVY